jgi:membrane protein
MSDASETSDATPVRRDWSDLTQPALLFGRMALDHAGHHQVPRVAASLSYTSLLALVPLLAIGLAMLAAFPMLEDMRGRLMDTLFEVLLPYAGEDIRTQVTGLVDAAGGLTALGVVGIAVTAVMLLVTIETAFNTLFGVRAQRALPARLLVYWAVVTLGPLLLGTSLSASGYLHALRDMPGAAPALLDGASGLIAPLLPWALAVLAFTILYLVVPNRPVRPLDALAGAIVAAGLVAVLRIGFLVYVTDANAYSTLYGALAIVPLFLVWMYLTWLVVLAGAVITATLPAWRMNRAEGDDPRRRDLNAALRVLARLLDAACRPPPRLHGRGPGVGVGVGRRRLLADTGLPEERLRRILGDLQEAGLVARADGGRWLLARDLDTVSLDDLLGLLGLRLPDSGGAPADAAWGAWTAARLNQAREAERAALDAPLRPLLSGEQSEDAVRPV